MSKSEIIRKLPGWITGFIAFVNTIVGFINLIKGDAGLVTLVLIVTGVGGGIIGCVYIAFKRTQSPVAAGRMIWQYPQWRRYALIGLVVLPLLSAGSGGYYLYRKNQPVEDTIIVLARFTTLSDENRDPGGVTKIVTSYLDAALADYSDLHLILLTDRVISHSDDAEMVGQEYQATVVIWGWYQEGDAGASDLVSVQFKVLRPPHNFPQMAALRGEPQQLPILDEPDTFELELSISANITALTLFIEGMTRYARGEWDEAIDIFDHAVTELEEQGEIKLSLDQEMIYFYSGNAYLRVNDFSQAIDNYTQAITLNPEVGMFYNNRGFAYRNELHYDEAIDDYTTALELNPDYDVARYNRATALYGLGMDNYESAIEDYTELIENNSKYMISAYSWRGATYYKMEKHDLAIGDFEKVITLSEDQELKKTAEGWISQALEAQANQ